MAVDLLHEVKRHAHRDQEARTAVEARDLGRNPQRSTDDRGNHRHERQESGADIGDPLHDPLEVVGGPLAWPVAGDERPEVLEVVGHLLRIEGDRGPEVAEEVDQHDVQHVVEQRLSASEGIVQGTQHGVAGIGIVQVLEEHLGKEQQRTGEDNRHHAGLIHPQRQILPGAAVHATAANMLGALRGNPALPLRHEHHARHHAHEECRQHKQRLHAHLAAATAQFPVRIAAELDQGTRHGRQDARHDQQADPVADPKLVNLFTQPHEEDRARRHRHHGHELPDQRETTIDEKA